MKRIVVSFFWIALIPCLMIFASSFLPQDKYLIISLLSLVFPIYLGFLLVALAVLIFFRHRTLLITYGLLAVVNYGNWAALFSISNRNSTSSQLFSVLSYNVRFFSIPSVFSPSYFQSESAKTGDSIVRFINAVQPDVVCLQEFFTDGESDTHNYLNKFRALGYKDYILAIKNTKNKTRRGIVTFSRYPIVDTGVIFISSSKYNGASFVDVQVDLDTIRVINVHLESMELYFSNKKMKDKIKHFWQQYTNAQEQHVQQINEIISFVRKSPYPAIIAGDFNELPFSYNHKLLKRELSNSFELSGNGFGATYKSGLYPLRIDHQYFNRKLNSVGFEVLRERELSDHFPIIGRYVF